MIAFAIANTQLSLNDILEITPKFLKKIIRQQSIKKEIDFREKMERERWKLTYLLRPYSDKIIKQKDIPLPWDNQNQIELTEEEIIELNSVNWDELDKEYAELKPVGKLFN